MHYVTGSDCTSYPYRNGKLTALKTLKDDDFGELHSILGIAEASDADLLSAGRNFF